jgi:hypothetical protein
MFKTAITPHNSASLDRNRALCEHVLCELLPHGSGINSAWSFHWFDNGNVLVSNSFHCMNDVGMYDGFADFTLRIKAGEPMRDFVLQFNGTTAQRKARRYDLRSYLVDTLADSLPHAVTLNNVLHWFNEYRAGQANSAPESVRHHIASFKE